ncbi:MAG: GNAT family N-acetyltransferase [Haloarculaceae archaeon]
MSRYEIRQGEGEADLVDAFAVRRAVFVDEQDVPEEIEMDDADDRATHFVVYDTARGEPVGAARLRVPEEATGKAERVAILKPYRGEGLGARLMERVEATARERGCSRLKLDAQTHVEGFYERLGYETVSDVFVEAGIPHVRMVTDL